jgi:hypothetical protein
MARRTLEEWQQHQVDAYLRQIVPTMLHPKQRATFISIKTYYEMDKSLSDKQIACLRRYLDITHSVSTKLNSDKHYDINDVFNVVANPMK